MDKLQALESAVVRYVLAGRIDLAREFAVDLALERDRRLTIAEVLATSHARLDYLRAQRCPGPTADGG